ncbi:MAG: DUF1028 domain-containing protein [Gemmatimonadetes bacterium]|nr:DUF1028 domain-containing protein [Gemmatimonadota bacterium]
MRRRLLALAAAIAVLASPGSGRAQDSAPRDPTASTFSILGYDPETGEIGVAVQSLVFSVGNGVIWGQAGVGVVATQAVANIGYGPRALDLLQDGLEPDEVVRRLLEEDPDPFPESWPKTGRQVAVMDASGRAAAWTGPEAPDWAGHSTGASVSVQGNLLMGPTVLGAMLNAFRETPGHLALRLVAALDAAQAAGGDRRGMQSAAILVVREGGGPWLGNDVELRLQVDDNTRPLVELRRLVELAISQRSAARD